MAGGFGIDMCGVTALIRSDWITVDEFVAATSHMLPSAQATEPAKPDLHIELSRDVTGLRCTETGFEISGDYAPGMLVQDCALVLSRYLERELNRRGLWSLHASAVALGERGVLLPGKSNCGKTSTAITVCQLCPEARVLSGDRAVIDEQRIVGGTTTVSIPIAAAPAHPAVRAAAVRSRSVTGKVRLPHFSGDATPARLSEIVVLLGRLPQPVQLTAPDDDRKFRYIHDSLCHFSDVSPNACHGQRSLVPYFNDPDLRHRRLVVAERIAATVEMTAARGDLDSTAADVAARLQR